MRGGRGAGRVLFAAALVALPLVGFAVLAAGSVPSTTAPREAVLRLLPGQAGEAQAVRPAAEADPGTRGAPGARQLGLLAVLLGTAAVVALTATGAVSGLRAVPGPAHPSLPATGRGPPLLPR